MHVIFSHFYVFDVWNSEVIHQETHSYYSLAKMSSISSFAYLNFERQVACDINLFIVIFSLLNNTSSISYSSALIAVLSLYFIYFDIDIFTLVSF